MKSQSKNGVGQICNMFSYILYYKCRRNFRAWLFLINLAQFHVTFTVWMLTLDSVILEHYWPSLETLSFTIGEIKNTNLVVDFVHIFLLIFLMYQNLLFTILWYYDYTLNASIFSSFIPSLGRNSNLNSKITLYTYNCKDLIPSMGGAVQF